jgi:hypothetical protein
MKTYQFKVYAKTKIGWQAMASEYKTEALSEENARKDVTSFYKLSSKYQEHRFELINPPAPKTV